MAKTNKSKARERPSNEDDEKRTRVGKIKDWAENHWLISILIVLSIVFSAIGAFTDTIDKIRRAFHSPDSTAAVKQVPAGQQSVGQDSVAIGRVEGPVGDRSVVIGPTDSNGNTILNRSMAVGFNAQAGPGSIAIGANAQAGVQTATATGSISSAANFSASTTGSNSPIAQTFIHNAYPSNELEEMRKEIREAKEKSAETLTAVRRMENFKQEKQKDPDFHALFPFGYLLFTATGRREIIPMQPSPMDEIEFRWREGYSVEITQTNAAIHLPPFVVYKGGSTANLKVGSITLPRTVGWGTSPMRFGSNVLTFLVVSTNLDETMVAAGLQPADMFEKRFRQDSRNRLQP